MCLVLATDHLISDDGAFEKLLPKQRSGASGQSRRLWHSRRPRNGYGYLEVAAVAMGHKPSKALLKSLTVRRPSNIWLRGAIIGTQACFFTAGVMARIWPRMPMFGRRLRLLSPKHKRRARPALPKQLYRPAGYFHRLCGDGKSREDCHGARRFWMVGCR